MGVAAECLTTMSLTTMSLTAMSLTAMGMEMRVQPMRRAAEAAIADAAIFPQASVRLAPEFRNLPGAAFASPHEPHRHRADGGGAHHGQNDTARTFHGAAPQARTDFRGWPIVSIRLSQRGKQKHDPSRDRAASGDLDLIL